MSTKRIKFIDLLKGFSIFLVVFGHLLQYNVIDGDHLKVFDFIYSFHMPLFMFLSGYVAFLTIKKETLFNYTNFILKKSRSLLLPFFSWPILVDGFFLKKDLTLNFYNKILMLVKEPREGLWFLWYVFIFTIIYSVFILIKTKINKNEKKIVDILIFISLTSLIVILRNTEISYIDSLLQYYIYFSLGILIAKYDWTRQLLMNPMIASLSLVLFMSLIGIYSFSENHASFGYLLIRSTCAITAINCCFYLANNVQLSDSQNKTITGWGTSSLAIYVTHFCFVHILNISLFTSDISFILLILIFTPVAVLLIYVCKLIEKIVQFFPVLNLILYGASLDRNKILTKENP